MPTEPASNPLRALHALGQSIWVDYIRRQILENGELARLIDLGVRGLTSNPTIFEQAIDGSDDYDAAIRAFGRRDDVQALYDHLTTSDIARAADLFRPVFDEAGGADGFVSLEVSPLLARDTDATVSEARRLFSLVDRPNLMIKVPATAAGVPAIRTLIADGLNINVTLIFSLDRYRAVIDAYLAGLEDRLAAGRRLDTVHSVASFFVSRVDTLVDKRLEALQAQHPEAAALFGKAAVANAKLAYAVFRETLESPRWARLREAGAAPQRPLWASTSTKNPGYPDLLYVETLIGPDTVNTVPPKTLEAILDHGRIRRTVDEGVAEARDTLARLEALGISMQDVTDQLEQEGVAAFEQSFRTLMAGLEKKSRQLV
jgi:transaldolase/glucose-6-phosphate isomerase